MSRIILLLDRNDRVLASSHNLGGPARWIRERDVGHVMVQRAGGSTAIVTMLFGNGERFEVTFLSFAVALLWIARRGHRRGRLRGVPIDIDRIGVGPIGPNFDVDEILTETAVGDLLEGKTRA